MKVSNKHRTKASEIIGHAYYCAFDFETDMHPGYVQCAFENWVRDESPSDLDRDLVLGLIEGMGFNW